jgi:hypothetical protein
MCVGEHISSVKEIVNRTQILRFPDTGGPSISIAPWFFGASTTNAGSISTGGPGGDILGPMGLMYAFFRGSMRVGIFNGGTTTVALAQNGATWVGLAPEFFSPTNWQTPGTACQDSYGVTVIDSSTPVQSVIVPYYNTVRMSLLDFCVSNSTTGIDFSVPIIAANFASSGGHTGQALRSAGEDFQLSYFLGCPPLLISFV